MVSRAHATLTWDATKSRHPGSIGILRIQRRLPLTARYGLQRGCMPKTNVFRATSVTAAGMDLARGCGVKRSAPYTRVSTRLVDTPQALGH